MASSLEQELSALENIRVPKFSAKDRRHRRMAELSERAHVAARRGEQKCIEEIERKIDLLAASICALESEGSKEIALSLKELSS
jgi:transcription elongation GreA/GreB family factor